MEKHKEFASDKIELCRNCQGSGKEESDSIFGQVRRVNCHICGGSGLMKKHIEGIVEVTPYNPRK